MVLKGSKSPIARWFRENWKGKTYLRLTPKAKKQLAVPGLAVKIGIAVFLGLLTYQWLIHPKVSKKTVQPAHEINTRPANYAIASPAAVTSPASVPTAKKIAAPLPVRIPKVLPPKVYVQRTLEPTAPKIVIVIDDMGHNHRNLVLLKNLGFDVTYAILPHLEYSQFFGELSRETGAEVILHQPLEAQNGDFPGPGLITTNMDDSEMRRTLRSNLGDIPYLEGINNHMGSLGTKDSHTMQIILKELKQRKLFFLDSRTTFVTVSEKLGRQIGVPVLQRDVFLDNIDQSEEIRKQMIRLARMARSQGQAIGIGHYRPNTLQVLNEEIPKLREEGFQFVSLGDLIRMKQGN